MATVHSSLISLVKLGNFLGVLPVTGLTPDVNSLSFSPKSWKSCYSFSVIALFLFDAILCFVHWSRAKFNFNLLATQMYYINALVAVALYVDLARKWPKFARKWAKIDAKMNPIYGFSQGLNTRIKIFTSVILAATLGEYVFWLPYMASKFASIEGRRPTAEEYYGFVFPEYSVSIPYNLASLGVAAISSLLSSLIWSFNDLFVISICTGLALRFKQISTRLQLNAKRENFWIDLRSDYDKLVYLARKADKKLSFLILLSFSSNISLLLIKLSNTTENMSYGLEITYYLYSFGLLMLRLMAVSLYAAWVNDASKEPANILNSVPDYNVEIRRFLMQLSFDDVAMSGSKMFNVTRGLLLSVAGAIVTYELVVVQFNKSFVEFEEMEGK